MACCCARPDAVVGGPRGPKLAQGQGLRASRPSHKAGRLAHDPLRTRNPEATMRPLTFVAAVLVLALPVCALAQDARHPITAQDLWAIKRVGAPTLSPDGRRAVVSVQEWSIEKNKPIASLWVVDVAGGGVRRLTNGDSSDGAAAWSTDGARVAFVAKRGSDVAASLYVIGADGGESERVLELPYGSSNPRWLPGDG